MPRLYTIVAQTGWDFSGLGDLLLGFLDKAEPLPFFFSFLTSRRANVLH
jgi:hypothetical protein